MIESQMNRNIYIYVGRPARMRVLYDTRSEAHEVHHMLVARRDPVTSSGGDPFLSSLSRFPV
jgi:hypothetical protein